MTSYWPPNEASPLEDFAHNGRFPQMQHQPHPDNLVHAGHQHQFYAGHIHTEPQGSTYDTESFQGSVPLPSEEFEPFLSEYAEYDQILEQSMSSIQDLGIGQPLQANPSLPFAGSEDFTVLKPAMVNKYAYHSTVLATSPPREMHTPHRGHAMHPGHLMSSPVPSKPRFFPASPLRGARPPPVPDFSTADGDEIPSSPPGSPAPSELALTSEPGPLGIHQNIMPPSSPLRYSVNGAVHSDALAPPSPTLASPPSSPSRVRRTPPLNGSLAWQPILTIPQEAQMHSEQIIRSQALAASESKSRRKSCLPPGTVDEYVGGPHEGGVYQCLYPHCGRLFRRRYNLRSHIQTHLSDRPYECEYCDATFVRPHDLRRHARCHSTARPYVCPCNKGFTRLDALQRHRHRMICKGGLLPPEDGGRLRSPPLKHDESESSEGSP